MCGQRRVVGVVGRGHLAGVMRAVEADQGGDTLVRDASRAVYLQLFLQNPQLFSLSVLTGTERVRQQRGVSATPARFSAVRDQTSTEWLCVLPFRLGAFPCSCLAAVLRERCSGAADGQRGQQLSEGLFSTVSFSTSTRSRVHARFQSVFFVLPYLVRVLCCHHGRGIRNELN